MRNTKASLKWIFDILNKLKIPFQVAGGLAANIYGANRELVDIDIDIPDDKFDLLKEHVKPFIIYGPAHFKDENWDLILMTLNHERQEIDLSGIYQTKIFNKNTQQWQPLETDLSQAIITEVFDITAPIISRENLLAYKRILARPVDVIDIDMITREI